MQTVDLVIIHGIVVTMEGDGAGIINDGAVAIRGADIVAVDETARMLTEYNGHRVIDATNKIVMPGLVDCHAHSSLAIARGTAQDIDNWLYKGFFPISANLDDDAIQIGSLLAIAEAVLNGTTTIGDYVDQAGVVLNSHLKVGNRCVITETLHEMPKDIYRYDPLDVFPFDRSVGQRRLENCKQVVDSYHGYRDGLVTCMVGPQAINMCSLEFMDEVYAYARGKGLPIHIHVSQSYRENIQCEKRYGKRAIPLLKERGYLGADVLSAHISHALPEEVQTMAQAGCPMVLCTNSMALINGILPPASEYLEMGGIVGLGTDQAPGNNRHNMFQEMKNGDLLNKCKAKNGTAFPAWQMLRMGTIDGARALGLDHLIGSLRPGKRADVIVVDTAFPHLTPIILSPVRNIVPNLVYAADGREVETVIVNGEVIVEDHRLVNIDLDAAIEQANAAGQRFSQRMEHFHGVEELPLVQWTRDGLY